MLNIYAPINNLGYGIHANNMIKAFRDNDIDVSLNTIGQVQPNTYYNKQMEELYGNYSLFDSNAPSLHIFHDEYVTQVGGAYPIAFSVFETTKLNPHALYNLTNVAKKVFTTTKAHKEILIGNGIDEGKIHVVHEGVDPFLYNYTVTNKMIDTGKFTYITVGKYEERKNTDMIIRAFINTHQYEECALICHTFNPFSNTGGGAVTSKQFTGIELEKYSYKQKIVRDDYMIYSNGVSDIYLTFPIPDQTKMKSLYHSANVGIACSRAEGWDLPLMELMACGIPCIASNVLGHLEYLPGAPKVQQDLIIEPIGMEVAQDGIWFHGDRGDWCRINSDDICEKLEDTYDNMDEYKTPSKELSLYYTYNYDWSLAAKQVKDILDL